MNKRAMNLAQFFTRLALSISMFSAVADRFGLWGPPGAPGVSWGNWSNFMKYSAMLTPYAGPAGAQLLGVTATACELIFAALLLIGLKTRLNAIGTFLLMLTFAISMTVYMGPKAPLSYSVWIDAGAAALLACVTDYRWSFDAVLDKSRKR